MNRLLVILCMLLVAVLPSGAVDSVTVPASQRMITSDVFLGIRARTTAESAKLEVAGVAPGSPAARADIRVGDVLVSVNGHRVGSREGLFLSMCHQRAGERLRLQLLRAGTPYSVEVTLQSRPAPAVIGYVHAAPFSPVAIGNLVDRQRALAAALARPGTTLADVEPQLRLLCRESGGRSARTGHIRFTYRDGAGLIRLRHRPGRLEIITSDGRDAHSATVLSQPWHTLPPTFQRRFRSIVREPKRLE